MKKLFAISGIFTLFLCIGFAHASDFTMTSNVDCSGECTVKQSLNGESVEVVSSGRTSMTTHSNDGKAEMAIDSTGHGEVRMNLNDGGDSNLNVKVGSEGSGEDSHPSINTTFNHRDNAPDVPRNLSQNRDNNSGNNASENETPEEVENGNYSERGSTNSICSGYQIDSDCSVQEGFGNPTHKTIKVNTDGTVETAETDGIFQRVYKFFQSFSARIFLG